MTLYEECALLAAIAGAEQRGNSLAGLPQGPLNALTARGLVADERRRTRRSVEGRLRLTAKGLALAAGWAAQLAQCLPDEVKEEDGFVGGGVHRWERGGP